MSPLRKPLIPLILIVLIISYCTYPEDDIKNLLKKRWVALQTKDINLYSECISPQYPEREELIRRTEENFKKIDSIRIISQEPAIYINQDTATVYQEVRLIITIKGKTQDLETREKLILQREGNGWNIIGGIK